MDVYFNMITLENKAGFKEIQIVATFSEN